jgi:hypothetical protein
VPRLTPAERAARLVSEAQFQSQIIKHAKLWRWRVHHVRPALTGRGWRTPLQGDKGFPDLVLAKSWPDGRAVMVLAELKAQRVKDVEPDQQAWLDVLSLLDAPQVIVATWRPMDWEDVRKVLEQP